MLRMRGSGWSGSSSSSLLGFFVSSRATQELSEGGRRALETIEALWEEGRADGTAEWASGPAFPALPERPGDKIASV